MQRGSIRVDWLQHTILWGFLLLLAPFEHCISSHPQLIPTTTTHRCFMCVLLPLGGRAAGVDSPRQGRSCPASQRRWHPASRVMLMRVRSLGGTLLCYSHVKGVSNWFLKQRKKYTLLLPCRQKFMAITRQAIMMGLKHLHGYFLIRNVSINICELKIYSIFKFIFSCLRKLLLWQSVYLPINFALFSLQRTARESELLAALT